MAQRILVLVGLLVADPGRAAAGEPWESLAPGLELGTFDGPKADIGDGKIHVLRIDPARFTLRLLNASAPGEGAPRTARAWASRAGAVAAINASMFRDDQRTSVSFMKTRKHLNNPRMSKDKTILGFDRLAENGPPVRLLDGECDELSAAPTSYGSLVQSIRMVTCQRRNAWRLQPKRWSTAAIGIDGKGRVLFIHARSPWAVHDLIERLLALPIDLARAMYVEGGPEATLYIRAGRTERDFVGSYETGFLENDSNHEEWPLPNVVVAVPVTPDKATR